jgi:hypothetical protein
MGIEPTKDPFEPHTDFEDQGQHQPPVTSASAVYRELLSLGPRFLDPRACFGEHVMPARKLTRAKRPRPDRASQEISGAVIGATRTTIRPFTPAP